MNFLETFLIGLGFSLAAGVLCAALALATGVLLNRRVRQKTKAFIRLLGWIDAARVSLFGKETIRVTKAQAQTTTSVTVEPVQEGNSSNTSLNWTVVSREDDPSNGNVKPFVSGESLASQASGTLIVRG
jgi:hypothetical protein